MIAVNNFAGKWNKTAYYLFSGYYIMENRKFYEKLLSLGRVSRLFFVNISTPAKAHIEILTKKSENSLRKWISLKIPVLPCSGADSPKSRAFAIPIM